MEWTKLPFVRATLCLLAGIFAGYYKLLYFDLALWVLLFTGVIFVSLHFLIPKDLKTSVKPYKGILFFIFIFFTGSTRLFQSHPELKNNYFGNQEFAAYQARLISPQEPYSKGSKGLFEVNYINTAKGWKRSNGKVILYFNFPIELHYGDICQINDKPSTIQSPLNPDEFNYKEYQFIKGITHTHFIKKELFIKTSNLPPSQIKAFAIRIAEQYDKLVTRYVKSKKAEALVLGFILGSKKQMDPALLRAFSTTGLSHILSVSGFHTALIYSILLFFLSFLKRSAFGNYAFTIIVISLMCLYAVVTGLSAPVIRATVMISLLLIGKTFKRNTSGIQILSVSTFFILLADPWTGLDLGFQLSVLAVLGISLYYKDINSFFTPKNYLLRKSWELTSVSLSAQFLTFPLLLVYFHHFPIYFIAANILAALPVILIIYTALLLPFLSFSVYLSQKLGIIITFLCDLMDSNILFFTKLPDPFQAGLYPNNMEALLVAITWICLYYCIQQKTIRPAIVSFVALLTLTISICIAQNEHSAQKKLTVFNYNKHTLISIIDGNSATILSDIAISSDSAIFRQKLKDFLGRQQIVNTTFKKLNSDVSISFNNKSILILSHKCKSQLAQMADLVILRNYKGDTTIKDFVRSEKIILDGSTGAKYRKLCNLSSYKTWENGAFILDLKD